MGIQPGTLQSGLVTATPSTDHTAPTSTINADRHASPPARRVTISGTASDVGGVIAGVEVSTDNGASWHPATGDETWTYTWSPQVAGTYTINSRAVDDSINLETPSAGRTVTVTAPSYVTPVPGLGNSRDREHDRCERGRTRREIPVLGGRHRQRHPLLQEQPGHRHPHRRAVVEHRHEAGDRHLHQRDRERLADGHLLQPGHDDAGRDLHRPPTTPMSATIPTRTTTSQRT